MDSTLTYLILLDVLAQRNVFQRLVVLDSTDIINVVACLGNAPHGLPERGRVVVVKSLGSQKFLKGLGGLESMVVGHFVEEVVSDVSRSDAVVEPVEDSVRSVNCGKSSTNPGPFTFSVLRNGRVGVLQPSVQDQPSIDDKVGIPVPKSDGKNAVLGRKHQVGQISKLGDGSECGKIDLPADFSREHGRISTEVIGDASVQRLSLVVELSGRCKSHQIQRPSHNQMGVDLDTGKGTISDRLMQDGIERLALIIGTKSVFFTGGRNVGFSIRQVVRATVVLGMGVLPGIVRHKEELVDDESDDIVPVLVGAESSVSAFVSNNPRTSHDSSHPEGVHRPSESPLEAFDRLRDAGKIGRKILGGSIQAGTSNGKVTDQVVHGPEVGSVKAVRGDGSLHLTLGWKFRGVLVQWSVVRDPVSIGIELLWHRCRLSSFSSLSHGCCLVSNRCFFRKQQRM